MEFRFIVTMAGLESHSEPTGTLEEKMERLLEAFQRTHPEVGPVVGADSRAGTIDVTFSLDDEDISAAATRAIAVFNEGLKAFADAGMAMGISFHGEAVGQAGEEAAEPERELQTA